MLRDFEPFRLDGDFDFEQGGGQDTYYDFIKKEPSIFFFNLQKSLLELVSQGCQGGKRVGSGQNG